MLSSCSQVYFPHDACGPDEFVADSYKINSGKFSILEMEGKPIAPLPADAMEEYHDFIDEDDILNINIYHPTRDDLIVAISAVNHQIGFQVKEGKIHIPDLGAVEVKGLTLDEARDTIKKAFNEQIEDVDVFISYKDRLSRKVELIGNVAAPYIPVDGKMRLFDLISRASLLDKPNLFKSYVLRDGQPLSVDFYKLFKLGDMSQNIVMHGGDKIYIASQEEAKVMIMGEVLSPRAVFLPDGFISLKEAIVTAGGIPFTGDYRMIMVIRGNLMQPRIYVLTWKHIIHLPNESLLLMPGDTVYVAAKPITEWNRFISQLLPSFSGIQQATTTGRVLGVGR